MAREMQGEVARIRSLRDEALESAGLAANTPQSAVFDRPDEGIGYRIGKVQKKAFDEIKGLRAKGLEQRAVTPPPNRLAAYGLGVFGQRPFYKPVRRGGAIAIDKILERRVPSRGAVALRSPAHQPQTLHQRSHCCGLKWGARVLRVRSVSREEVWASAGVQGAWVGGAVHGKVWKSVTSMGLRAPAGRFDATKGDDGRRAVSS